MKLDFDFSELVDFGERLGSTYILDTALMTATQNIARVLHQFLLVNTPVKTGNLRKMWSAGENLAFTVIPNGFGYDVILINQARADDENGYMYGEDVNDGNSRIVGRFFVEASILQTLPQVESIVMNELQKWWDSV